MTLEKQAERRLHRNTLFISFLRQVPEAVLAMPAIVGVASSARAGTLLLLAGAGALIAASVAVLTWLRFSYRLGSDHIVIRSGVVARRTRSISFDRVQDVTIERPLLARLFGVAVLKLETGSSDQDEGELNAISVAEAQHIRDLVRTAASAKNRTAAQEPAPPRERTVFAMRLPRLALAGVFSFSLVFLALLAGALELAAPLLDIDFLEHHRWMRELRRVADHLSLGGLVGAAAVLLVLGTLTGVAQTIARDYHFQLVKTDGGFRRRRGLFTTSEAAFAADRVQAAVVVTGPVRRWLGWFKLEFQTLGSESEKGGHQVAAPLARRAEIMQILEEAKLPGIGQSSTYLPVSRRMVLHRSVVYMVVLAATAILLAPWWRPALMLLLLLPACAAVAEIQWRHHSYCVGEDGIRVRVGFFKQRLWVIPLPKVQAVIVSHSFAQRPWNLASILIDTAGASRFLAPRITDVDGSVAHVLVQLVEALPVRSNEPVHSAREDLSLTVGREGRA